MTLSSTSTRALYGMDFASAADLGGNNPPLVDGNINGTGNFMPDLATIQSAGARCFLKFTGTSGNVRVLNASSQWSFSLNSWKSQMDKAFTHATNAQIAPYVTSGALVAHYMLDDIKSGNAVFELGPTFLDLEAMAQYSKSVWPSVPCMVRCDNIYLRSLATTNASTSSYSWMDFGWAQWATRFGTPETEFTNHINAGKAVRLGSMAGFLLLNGGKGDVAPWDQHPSSPHLFGMSPTELDAVTAAYVAHKADLMGLFGWSANPTWDPPPSYYGTYTGIPDALTRMANAVIGQRMGPINTHNQTSSTSSSPSPVVGNWALRDHGVHFRSNNPSSPDIPLPTTQAGDLLCIATYTRDLGLTVAKPSDMSEAKRISGTSAQGGELCLFTKIAAGTEGGTTKTLSLSGSATNVAFQAQAFSFSGNTSVVANLVQATSATSWAAGSSNMGPLKGIASASQTSDNMILIIAAKANDFNNGDPPDFNTMSLTTADSETWNRFFMTTNVSGDDSGLFGDYAFLNGKQSITTKSWTQSTASGAGSNASAAGCGIIVAFTPTLIASVTPTPPALVEISPLDDVALSLGDTLNFTLTVTSGSTPITYSALSAPSNLTISSTTGAVNWTPLTSGTYYIILKATNSAGSDTDDFFAVVSTTTVNHAPVITNPGDMTVLVQERTTFTVAATDQDGDTLAYTLDAGGPDGATINSTNGFFDYTPQAVGAYPAVVVVSDGRLESRSTFTFTVTSQTQTHGGLPWTKILGPHLSPAPNQFRRL